MPIVRHDYPRRKALQSDIDRYYGDCLRSSTARNLPTLSRRKEYCSGVAWKRVKLAGRYKDYNPIDNTDQLLITAFAIVGAVAIARAVLK